jgi:hypothetical protein
MAGSGLPKGHDSHRARHCHTHAALRLQFFSIVLLVGGSFAALLDRIRRAKLEARVMLLELELRMAELAQAIVLPSSDLPASRP